MCKIMQKEDNVAIKQRQNDSLKIIITYRIHIHPYTDTLTKNSWEWRFSNKNSNKKDWNPDSDVINLMDNYNNRTKKKKLFWNMYKKLIGKIKQQIKKLFLNSRKTES